MSARDFKIVIGCLNAYIVSKLRGEDGSYDRRPISNKEILDLFEFFLRRYCEDNKTDSFSVLDPEGNVIFEARLLLSGEK